MAGLEPQTAVQLRSGWLAAVPGVVVYGGGDFPRQHPLPASNNRGLKPGQGLSFFYLHLL